jgi:hypothetical protein
MCVDKRSGSGSRSGKVSGSRSGKVSGSGSMDVSGRLVPRLKYTPVGEDGYYTPSLILEWLSRKSLRRSLRRSAKLRSSARVPRAPPRVPPRAAPRTPMLLRYRKFEPVLDDRGEEVLTSSGKPLLKAHFMVSFGAIGERLCPSRPQKALGSGFFGCVDPLCVNPRKLSF